MPLRSVSRLKERSKIHTTYVCNRDIDECENDICSPGMKCINTKGSYTCKCPANMFQDSASVS